MINAVPTDLRQIMFVQFVGLLFFPFLLHAFTSLKIRKIQIEAGNHTMGNDGYLNIEICHSIFDGIFQRYQNEQIHHEGI